MSRYGWEEDAEKLWLMHFNRSLLASGIITQEEYGKVEAAIRAWLNGDFLNIAFSYGEQEYILSGQVYEKEYSIFL